MPGIHAGLHVVVVREGQKAVASGFDRASVTAKPSVHEPLSSNVEVHQQTEQNIYVTHGAPGASTLEKRTRRYKAWCHKVERQEVHVEATHSWEGISAQNSTGRQGCPAGRHVFYHWATASIKFSVPVHYLRRCHHSRQIYPKLPIQGAHCALCVRCAKSGLFCTSGTARGKLACVGGGSWEPPDGGGGGLAMGLL